MAVNIGQYINGRYRVDVFLGKGAMAEVYKVWDMERNVHLAMKVLHADLAEDRVFLRRFKREAETLSSLQHPNIVRFYGMEREGDLVYMLMDYVDGVTLRKEIFQKEGPFSLQRILDVMRPVCSALYYAHKLGYVHCDIKPANIIIQKNGNVLVADFGISRMTEASTATMVGAGTPAYMSPEQIMGCDLSPQMDIYALGVVLFEMLTGGERPFTGDNAMTAGTNSEKIRWEQLRLPPPPPSKYNLTITPDIDAIVLKCLDKDIESRYQDAMDLFRDILAIDSVSDINEIPSQEQQPETGPISDSTKPVSLSHGGNKKFKALNNKKIMIGIGLVIIGSLCVLMTVAGSIIAISSYQNSVRVTGTAQALNVNNTFTQQAAFLYATATKQDQNARATATKQSALVEALTATQSYEVTATALQFNEISDITPFNKFGISLGVNEDCSGDQVGEIFSQEDLFKNDWAVYVFWPSNLSLSQYSPKLSLFSEEDGYLIKEEDLDLRLDNNSCAWHHLWVSGIKPGNYTLEITGNGQIVYRKNILVAYSDLTTIPRPERMPLGQFTIGRYGIDSETCKVNSPVVSVSVSELREDEWFYFVSSFQIEEVGVVVTWSLYNDSILYYDREERIITDNIDLCFWQGFSLEGAPPGRYTLEIEVSGSESKKYEFIFYVKQ